MAHLLRWQHNAGMLVAAVLAAGGQTAMAAETRLFQPPPETYETPLPFMRHSFAAYAYNTLSCSVVYGNHEFTHYALDVPRPPPPSPGYRDNWKGGYLGIRNFPSPVVVRWTSLDGAPHELTIDLAEVFKDQLVWHQVQKGDLPDFYTGPSVPGGPQIDIEVNDRTVSIYTSMFLPTRSRRVADNPHTNYRDDRLLAWTHTE